MASVARAFMVCAFVCNQQIHVIHECASMRLAQEPSSAAAAIRPIRIIRSMLLPLCTWPSAGMDAPGGRSQRDRGRRQRKPHGGGRAGNIAGVLRGGLALPRERARSRVPPLRRVGHARDARRGARPEFAPDGARGAAASAGAAPPFGSRESVRVRGVCAVLDAQRHERLAHPR
jgi:hypothetical protein